MRKVIIAIVVATLLVAAPVTSYYFLKIAGGEGQNLSNIRENNKRLLTAYASSKNLKARGSPNQQQNEKELEAQDRVTTDFIDSVYTVNSEHIWKDLIPEEQQGGVAALIAVDTSGGEQQLQEAPFDIQLYDAMLNDKKARKAAFEGFRDGLREISKSGEIKQVEIATSGNAAVAFVTFKDSQSPFPVSLVKVGKEWTIDFANFSILTEPRLLLESVYGAALDYRDAGDTGIAKNLLQDLMGLEGCYDRLTSPPYTELLKEEVLKELEAVKPRFAQIKTDLDGLK